MNKDMIKYLAIAGGAYLVYWYITNYGPGGAVSATNPVSYWNSWFGMPVATPAAATGVQPTGVMPSITNPQPVLTQPGTAAPATSTARAQMLSASAGDPAITGGYAIPDVWSYYWQHVTGMTITPTQMATMFPPVQGTGTGAPLNIDQFLAKLPTVGLAGIGMGAIVATPSAPSLPSLSFGGAITQPGLRGMGGRGPGMRGPGMGRGGTTIQ